MAACLANFCFKVLHSDVKLFLFKKIGNTTYILYQVCSNTTCGMPTLNIHVAISNIYIDGELLKNLLPKGSVILTNNVIPLFCLHVNYILHKGIKNLNNFASLCFVISLLFRFILSS